ncbi:MAG: hypothetical protein SFW67_35435 [Myxococcaceae bacterium]|nr:hypothetical protein [Myxococcaceae bacterium]
MSDTTDSIETAEQVDELVSALDLRAEARAALARGESVRLESGLDARGQVWECLIVDETRAGVVAGADAQWGDLCAARGGREYVQLDDGAVVALDGSQVEVHELVPDDVEEARSHSV